MTTSISKIIFSLFRKKKNTSLFSINCPNTSRTHPLLRTIYIKNIAENTIIKIKDSPFHQDRLVIQCMKGTNMKYKKYIHIYKRRKITDFID